jgi:hypothetical protein
MGAKWNTVDKSAGKTSLSRQIWLAGPAWDALLCAVMCRPGDKHLIVCRSG